MDQCKSKVIYELEVANPVSKEQAYEDTPEAYRIEEADTASGILVFGRYPGHRWVANPNCRELIAHLLRTSSASQPTIQADAEKSCKFCGCLLFDGECANCNPI